MSNLHELPQHVFAMIESGVVAEFATVSAAGMPIDTPTYYENKPERVYWWDNHAAPDTLPRIWNAGPDTICPASDPAPFGRMISSAWPESRATRRSPASPSNTATG